MALTDDTVKFDDPIPNYSIQIQRVDNPDSLEIGTPSKGGVVKVYGDFNKPDEFERKIANAIRVRGYANSQLAGG